MSVAGPLDPVVEAKLLAQDAPFLARLRPRAGARRVARNLRGDRTRARRHRLRRAAGSAGGRLGALRRDRRLSRARRARFSRARDHAARPAQALRRALLRRRRARSSPTARPASFTPRPNSSNSSGRRSTRRWNSTFARITRAVLGDLAAAAHSGMDRLAQAPLLSPIARQGLARRTLNVHAARTAGARRPASSISARR